MFLDERINKEKSKVYSRAIFYATLISVLYLIINSIIFNFRFVRSIPEIFIIITGTVIIIMDIYKFGVKSNDERLVNERVVYYEKAAKIFLSLSLLGVAIAIPLQFLNLEEAALATKLFTSLEVLGFVYFAYSLKKNKIYFNYSFIEKEEGYYREVAKNMIKLIIMISIVYLIAFILAGLIFLIYSWMIAVMIALIFAFIISAVNLTLYYLFISFIERESYKSILNSDKHLKSQFIVGILYVVIQFIIIILRYKYRTFDFSQSSTEAVQIISRYVDTVNGLSIIATILFAMLVTNIFLQYKDRVKGINFIIFASICTQIFTLLITHVNHWSFFNNTLKLEMLRIIISYINIAFSIINFIGVLLLFIYLVKKGRNKVIIFVPIISFVFTLISNVQPEISNKTLLIISILQIVNISISTSVFMFNKNHDEILVEDIELNS